ncbi:MAG TPA: GIY-YIG nuclease family protein [Dehalococcoidia bacterium]|nr:GIY-YIG nuclease family protein [Dehalococcoidia bacterium]
MSEWYLYLIRCNDGSFYTGITIDVVRRLAEHQGEGNTGAKYVRGRRPLTLVLQKKLGSKGLAMRVERRVKKLSKPKKEKLIVSNEHIEEIIKQERSKLNKE